LCADQISWAINAEGLGNGRVERHCGVGVLLVESEGWRAGFDEVMTELGSGKSGESLFSSTLHLSSSTSISTLRKRIDKNFDHHNRF
jgi:hypothetical protein